MPFFIFLMIFPVNSLLLNTMRDVSVFLITLLFLSHGLGQDATTNDAFQLDKSNLDTSYGKDFKGILFECLPFCQFLSLKEDKTWLPEIKPRLTKKSAIKVVRKTDPIYPLLITRLPIRPYVTESAESAPNADIALPASPLPPDYAVMPFNFGYTLGTGFNFSNIKTDSNTAVQSQFQSKAIFPSLKFVGNAMKGKPFPIFSYWVLPEIELSLLVGSQFKTHDNTTFFHQLMELPIYFWIAHKNFKQGPVITISNESYTSSINSLTHYAFSEQNYLFGWSFRYRHWALGVHTAIQQSLNETQDFRQAPLTIDLYKFHIQKCSGIVPLFDINFQFCGGGSYSYSKQNSKFDSAISPENISEITYARTMLFTTLKIGEDLFK